MDWRTCLTPQERANLITKINQTIKKWSIDNVRSLSEVHILKLAQNWEQKAYDVASDKKNYFTLVAKKLYQVTQGQVPIGQPSPQIPTLSNSSNQLPPMPTTLKFNTPPTSAPPMIPTQPIATDAKRTYASAQALEREFLTKPMREMTTEQMTLAEQKFRLAYPLFLKLDVAIHHFFSQTQDVERTEKLLTMKWMYKRQVEMLPSKEFIFTVENLDSMIATWQKYLTNAGVAVNDILKESKVGVVVAETVKASVVKTTSLAKVETVATTTKQMNVINLETKKKITPPKIAQVNVPPPKVSITPSPEAVPSPKPHLPKPVLQPPPEKPENANIASLTDWMVDLMNYINDQGKGHEIPYLLKPLDYEEHIPDLL